MGGVERDAAKEAMRLAAYKLPIRTRFVEEETGVLAGAAKQGADTSEN